MLIFFLFLFCADLFLLGCKASPSEAVSYENEDEIFYDRFGTCNFLFKDEDITYGVEDSSNSSVEVSVPKDQSHSVVASEDGETADYHDYHDNHDYEDDKRVEDEKASILTLNAPVSKAIFSSKNAFSNLTIDENSTSSDIDDNNDGEVIDDVVQTVLQISETSKVSKSDHSSDIMTLSAPKDQNNKPENLKTKKSKSAKNNKKRQAHRKNLQARKEFIPLPIHFLTNTHTTRESPQGIFSMKLKDTPSTGLLFFGRSPYACFGALSLPEQLRKYKSFYKEIYSPQEIDTMFRLLDVSISSSSGNVDGRIATSICGLFNKEKLECEAANCSCKHLIIAPSLSPFHIAKDPTDFSALAAFDEEDFRRGIYLISKLLPTLLEEYSIKVLSEMKDVYLNIWEHAKETLIKSNNHALFVFNLFCRHPKIFEDIEEFPLELFTCKSNMFSLLSILLKTPIDCDQRCAKALNFLINSTHFCVHDNTVKGNDVGDDDTLVHLTMKDIRPWWLAVQTMAHMLEEDPYMAGVFNQQVFRSLAPFVLKLHTLYAINNHCLSDIPMDSLHPFYQRTLAGYNDLIRIARFMAIFSEIPPCRIDFVAEDVENVAIAAGTSRPHGLRSKNSGKRNGNRNSSKAINQKIGVFKAYYLAKEYVCPFDIFSSQSCSTFLSMLEGDRDCVDDDVDNDIDVHDVNDKNDDDGDDTISANVGAFSPYTKFNYKNFESWEALNWAL